jgi:triacylglycerol esterase/lipase EstA (alpha/beta hydrolase family)
MKTKLLISLLLIGVLFQANAQNVFPEMKSRPADFEYLSAPDSLGVRHQLKMPKVEDNRTLSGLIKIPYPIIFIHGLDSDASTWDSTTDFMDSNFNFTYGGRLDFNLNYDNSNSTSNKLFHPQTGADIAQWFTNPSYWINGDYYYLNFAVGSDGSYNPLNISPLNVLSNEAAIAKQGAALSKAIQQVMNITGRDKVILFGHSMGGLAAREYLQNPSNWTEPNINHHVAKLITTGTPHGGYTGSNFFLATGINSSSEAYRDLRTEYSNSNSGVFLFGGIESTLNIGSSYHNNNINCNGINNDGIDVQGLNEKDLPTNTVDFAYIMGNCTDCVISQGLIPGDGVVRLVNANLSNFQTLPSRKNEFIYTASSVIQIHGDLPKQTYENMQGLDEPNEYNLAYGVELGEIYKGFITVQPVGGYPYDWDDYKFVIQGNGNQILTISNSSTNSLGVRVYNSALQLQGQVYTAPNGISQFSFPLTAGEYFLEINGVPTSTSYLYPYNFTLSATLSNPDFTSSDTLKIYPNPTSSAVFFDNTKLGFTDVQVFNYLGQEVAREQLAGAVANQEINISNLSAGVYVLKFHNGTSTATAKVVKQ